MNDFREYSELYHHGIRGMHWGIRRYQNEDGTLTPAGRKRYEKDLNKLDKKASQHFADADMYASRANEMLNKASNAKNDKQKNKRLAKAAKLRLKADEEHSKGKEYEAEQWKGIADALERRADITRTSTLRTNEQYMKRFRLGYFIAGPAGALVSSAVFNKKFKNHYKNGNTPVYVKGNKFKLSFSPDQKGTVYDYIDINLDKWYGKEH